ncbi:hypothetical protein VOLCADRAFT_78672 [Volvox carteri f. nagariensis]|uniref:CAAX prenyl protease n=1 Tax=Volvox carteri f. nagariensis TaxID=3068 RepID=D8THC5_VOLCA|nr:uncharacterized protein VOLCADRAFT_78672 [Volvox carteri f. nagariensis]EFJ52686.1 hypothetical protein VOLCADRAFT_78672 [Volvox carteri f. nagariensis]|eukprot:XP_002945691.1 hypothetical protein VOLCADRAFT_78672 [Volvox carteri f. nagariensis]
MATVIALDRVFKFDDAGVPYLHLYVGFTVAVYLFHTYLDVRQLRALRRPSPPEALAGLFSPELYAKTRAYNLDKWSFSFAHSLYSTVETLALILAGVLPYVWVFSGNLLRTAAAHAGPGLWPAWLSTASGVEIAQTVLFVFLLFLGNLVIELPWGLYSTFVIEQRHGFNKQTLGLYVSDLVKQVLLAAVLLPPIVAGITYILQVAGPMLPLYLWGFIFALSLFFMTIYPVLIAPLFNKYEPLPEGSLRSKIEALAGSLRFPLRKLYRVDGSRRSAHSNAYMYGFFNNKRIVLYDTLIQQCSEEQVVAVLAHELGHWKLFHTPQLFIVNQVVLVSQFCLYTLVRNSTALPAAFGFGSGEAVGASGLAPAFISLILFQFIVSPLDEVIHYASNVVSRRFEFQADAFAVHTGHGTELRSALLKMEEENKGAMHVDPWYSSYHYSHPPLVDRLKAIDSAVKKAT